MSACMSHHHACACREEATTKLVVELLKMAARSGFQYSDLLRKAQHLGYIQQDPVMVLEGRTLREDEAGALGDTVVTIQATPESARVFLDAFKYRGALQDLDEWFRGIVKHGSDEVRAALADEARLRIRDSGVSIWED